MIRPPAVNRTKEGSEMKKLIVGVALAALLTVTAGYAADEFVPRRSGTHATWGMSPGGEVRILDMTEDGKVIVESTPDTTTATAFVDLVAASQSIDWRLNTGTGFVGQVSAFLNTKTATAANQVIAITALQAIEGAGNTNVVNTTAIAVDTAGMAPDIAQMELDLMAVNTQTLATSIDTGVIAGDTTSIDDKIDNGGGVEAGAVLVTMASDSTGVLSVDDNGSNLSVDDGGGALTTDWAGTAPPIGAGVEATALRVTVATDSTGVLSVDDNGTTLSVDDGAGALSIDDGGNVISTDWNGTVPPIGAGTEAAALRITVATDSTGVLSVDDNATTLSVDDGAGTLTTDWAGVAPPIGAGTEATALKVTIATDSTGLLSVDDNGGALTTDWAGTAPPIGGGTEATALKVTMASDSTGVLSVDDNGASLTIDGTVTLADASTNTISALSVLDGTEWTYQQNFAAAQTDTVVKACPAGKRIVMKFGFITSNATNNFTFQDEDDALVSPTIYMVGAGSGAVAPPGDRALLWIGATDKDLEIDTTQAVNHGVWASGYVIE